MVACIIVGEYKRNHEKIKRFFLEEKAKQTKEEELRARQARAKPLQPATTAQQNMVNRKQLDRAEIISLARRNQQAQKRARTTRQANCQNLYPSKHQSPPRLLPDRYG